MDPVTFQLASWSAIAPGLHSEAHWRTAFACDPPAFPDDAELELTEIKRIPAMLRRRLGQLGKCAAQAGLTLLGDEEKIPVVYASRHGNTPLTLSLLTEIAGDEPLSPTQFSLAVHNAISGLVSIARHDHSPINAIAAAHGLLLQALLESVSQLDDFESVLCVVYDVPLPELYTPYCDDVAFPYALALRLSRGMGDGLSLQLERASDDCAPGNHAYPQALEMVPLALGLRSELALAGESGHWRLRHA